MRDFESDVRKIFSHIDTHFDRHLERVRTFVRQPSISGEGVGMEATAEMVASSIAEAAGRSEIVSTPGWPVVYGEIDEGKDRTLLLYGMYDVQPVVGEDWLVPPFAGEITDFEDRGPSVVARGVYNTKGPLACTVSALQSIRAVAGSLPVNVKFMIEGEEELGSPNLPRFVSEHRDRLAADSVYFPFFAQNAAGRPVLWLGVKGIVPVELVFRGGKWGGPTVRGIHGSQGAWMASPVWRMVHALKTMVAPDERVTIDGFYDNVKPPTAEDEEVLGALAQVFDANLMLRENDVMRFKHDLGGRDLLRRYLFDPILNIDGIVGGHHGAGNKTLLPHEVRVKMHFRLVPDMEPDEVREKLRAHLRKIGDAGLEAHFPDGGYPWARMSPSAAISQAMIRTMRSFDLEPEVWPNIAGSAPFYLFSRVLEQPFTMGGLGHGGRAHSPNEYATVEGMRLFEKSFVRFLYEFASMESNTPS